MAAAYVLRNSPGNRYHWYLRAGNNEKILTSETYNSKAGAKNGIQSCRTNSPLDSRYDKRVAQNGQFYFVLKAGNGEIIGTSERYTTQAGRDGGIASCKVNGPNAPLDDQAT